MMTYKEHIFLSIIDNVNLQESYNQGDTSLLEMLLEAPIDDKTLGKMISDKKRASVYYQGDNKSKKGWYSVEPIRIDKKNGKSYLLTYIIPKDGTKPVLQYLDQSKIVNWNILGKKEADLPKEYEKKLFKFFKDPKIPDEKKKSFVDKLSKVGVSIKRLLGKGLITAAIVGGSLGAASYGGDAVKKMNRDIQYSNVDSSQIKVSKQVQNQLNYLRENKTLENEYFTILDDKNSKVYSITPGYKIAKEYKVITGRDVGDQLKTGTIVDFAAKNWEGVLDQFFKSPKKAAAWLDKNYFDLPEWKKRNTPSGVFKRAGNIKNFVNDKIATTFIEADYGKRFITWETLDGQTIPFGFHGTKNEGRLKKLNSEDIKGAGLNVSFGCINFKEGDVQEINDFITSGQITIWLPDSSNDIVKVPTDL